MRSRPDGLSFNIVERWHSGRSKHAVHRLWDAVMAWMAEQPSTLPNGPETLTLTPELVATLNAQFERSGMSVVRFWCSLKNPPAALSVKVIEGWRSGKAEFADTACWALVMARLEKKGSKSQPALRNPRKYKQRRSFDKAGRIALSSEMVAHLKAELGRTGVGLPLLLRSYPEEFAGVRVTTIQNWLYQDNAHSVDAKLWASILSRLAELPCKARPQANPSWLC